MTHVLYGERRANLVRSLHKWGTRLGSDDWGEIWVQDGKVWRVDASTAQLLGEDAEYRDKQRNRKEGHLEK